MKDILFFLKKHSPTFSALVLSAATLLSFLFFHYMQADTTSVALIYLLALVLIARWTDGYLYGIVSACISGICVNFLFTLPYLRLDFRPNESFLTFIGTLIITIITSATTSNLKQQSQILAEKEKLLAEADKEKMRANLLRAVSHDLRTPLTSIIGAAASYTDNFDSYTEVEKMELVHNIYDDANWLLSMVENLLSVTRIQSSCQRVSTTPEVVDEVIAEAVQRLKKRIPEADVLVSTPDEFLMIPMDAMLIEQVIINLLENALIHSQSPSPPLLSVEADDQQVTFHIYDQGVGIDESRLPTLFDGSGETSDAVDGRKGMGIGLSICKTIILAHNGSITARNHDEGAEFCFTLPKEEHYESQI